MIINKYIKETFYAVKFGDICKTVADCSKFGRNAICDFIQNVRVCKCNTVSEINAANNYCILKTGLLHAVFNI